MRKEKLNLAGDAVGILGQFIDTHAGNRILVKGNQMLREGCTVLEAPRGALLMRYELDNKMLYISRAALKKWVSLGMGSYTALRADLQTEGVLKNLNKKKVLGAGTPWGGAQQVCWEVDMSSDKLTPELQQLVDIASALEKAPVKV